MMWRNRSRGFTLLELLVALAVFAVVSTLAYTGLRTVLQGKAATDAQAAKLKELQMAVLFIERDLGQAVARPVRDEFGDSLPALRSNAYGDYRLDFTRAGHTNPMGLKRSRLQRIAYGVQDRRLVRYAWAALDRPQGSEPMSATLLDGVTDMKVRFMGEDKAWHEQWPDTGSDNQAPPVLPVAVEVTLNMDNPGDIRRLILLPAPVAVSSGTDGEKP